MRRSPNEEITADQTAHLPDTAAKTVQEAVTEYEAARIPTAGCARDADEFECLIQPLEYRAAGYAYTQGWIDTDQRVPLWQPFDIVDR